MDGSKRGVQVVASDHPNCTARAEVGTDFTGCIEVSVDVVSKIGMCSCMQLEETGLLCANIKAVLIKIQHGSTPDWIDSRFLVRSHCREPQSGHSSNGDSWQVEL